MNYGCFKIEDVGVMSTFNLDKLIINSIYQILLFI